MRVWLLLTAVATVAAFASSARAETFAISQLLPAGTRPADIVELAIDESLKPIETKITSAWNNDPALLKEMRAKMRPGEALPYDSRFGVSKAEYDRYMAGLQKPTFVKLAGTTLTIEKDKKGTLSVRCDVSPALKSGLKVEARSARLFVPSLGWLAGGYFQNRKTPVAPNDGFSWRAMRPEDWDPGTAPPFHEGEAVRISVSKLLSSGLCLLGFDRTAVEGGKPVRDRIQLRYACGR